MNIDKCVKKFINTIAIERNLSERTLKAYESDLKLFTVVFGQENVIDVTLNEIRRFIQILEENHHYKDTTIKRKIATIKVFFTFLEDEGIIPDSPTRKIKRKYKIAKRLPKVMSIREIKKLLRAVYREIKYLKEFKNKESVINTNINVNLIRAYRNRAILELLFSTGMRIGELIMLNINDINFQDRTILIFGKGRKERIIYISSNDVLNVIKEYFIYRKYILTKTQAFFLNKNNDRLSIYSIENIFKKYCTIAKIKNHYTPHCLRHTIATMLLNNGADIRQVQEILGHSSIVTTQIYIEVSPKNKKKVLMKYNPRNDMKID